MNRQFFHLHVIYIKLQNIIFKKHFIIFWLFFVSFSRNHDEWIKVYYFYFLFKKLRIIYFIFLQRKISLLTFEETLEFVTITMYVNINQNNTSPKNAKSSNNIYFIFFKSGRSSVALDCVYVPNQWFRSHHFEYLSLFFTKFSRL